jgi:hypothetical protein
MRIAKPDADAKPAAATPSETAKDARRAALIEAAARALGSSAPRATC